MTRSLVLLYCTDFLERVSYYAFISILSIQIFRIYDPTSASIGLIYKLLFTAGTLAGLLGAFFGDLTRRSPLFAIIGLGLNILGLILLALGIPELAKTAILLIIIGSSVFKPNLFACLFAVTREKRAKFEGFNLILWIVTVIAASLGSFVGGWFYRNIQSDESLIYVGAGCAVLSLFSIALILINYKTLKNNVLLSSSETYKGSSAKILEVLLFLFVVFWIWVVMPVIRDLADCVPKPQSVGFESLGALLFLGAALTISFATRVSIFFKTAIGFMAILGLLELAPLLDCNYSIPLLKSMAEAFIVPILCARILLSCPPRFTGTFIAISSAISMFSVWTHDKLAGIIQEEPVALTHGLAFWIIVLSGLVFVAHWVRKNQNAIS